MVGAVSLAGDADALMRRRPVIPILTIDAVEQAVPLAQALVRGGLDVMEVTLRTPVALEAIREIGRHVPEALLGAGTVLNRTDLAAALEAGAKFIVTPGLTDGLLDALLDAGVPLLPGVASASEVMRALDVGLTRFKFFPAEAAGGPASLSAFQGPFAMAKFCPTGGVSAANAAAYLLLPNVLCVGGSWVAPASAIGSGDWPRITALARAAAALERPLVRA